MLPASIPAVAQPAPILTWITNSSVKLEQVIGDVDWADGSNVTSQTISRFNIEGTDVSATFLSGTNRIYIFGDTIGSNINYQAADPVAWSSTADGETGLLLNFYTNRDGSNVFVDPKGISMAGDDTPNAGICISNVNYLICNTGSNTNGTNSAQKHAGDYSVLVTFNQTNLTFQTNRTISVLTNGGHFIINSLHLFGTNVLMFGEGGYRASDIYLATTPVSSYLSGNGTLYFTGLTNGQPNWSSIETNAVPVVQDNPTNGPPSVGNLSVIYSTSLNLWLMAYDGGRNTASPSNTTGIYFCSAAQPWGPWSTPQLIFNSTRDRGAGVFIHDNRYNPPGLIGPTINPSNHNPTNTEGTVYSPDLIESFTTISNSTLDIYYLMATWNPYTIVKMRSAFTINPVIDPASLVKSKKKFSFAWTAPTSIVYQVDYSTNLLAAWNTITNLVTSTNGIFNFTDNGTNSGGFGNTKFYRLQSLP
ncbi:MAG: DUF4185 domain-containing protein [Limisphaerales bacterium]